MKPVKLKISIVILSISFIMILSNNVFPREFDFLPIDIHKISTYNTNRVVYQRIEKYTTLSKDNSYEVLLIIKEQNMFLMMDGFDGAADLPDRKKRIELLKLYDDKGGDLIWTNKINGKPDYIMTTERRKPAMINANEEFVATNFGNFYKAIREKFISEHVQKYHQILRNRSDSDFYLERKPILKIYYDSVTPKEQEKYYTLVKVRSSDDTMYTCEDADGDGVTETFLVHASDGFNWGIKSGPNLIFINKNTDKDVEVLIGKLANEAVFGSVEDEKIIIETFPKEKDISDMIKWLTPLDQNLK